jgi:hypothetical protein
MLCLLCSCTSRRESPASRPETALGGNLSQNISLTHDFGRIVAGETLRHAFLLRNETDGYVQILKDEHIVRTCGISALEVDRRELEPKASTQATITLRTAGHEASSHVLGSSFGRFLVAERGRPASP